MTSSAIEAPIAQPGTPGPAVARLSEMPAVNLMPREIAERGELQRVKAICAGAVALSVLVVGGLYYQAHSGVTSAKRDLATAQSQQAVAQTQVNALASVAQTYATVEAAKAEVAEALGGEIQWSGYLDDLGLTIPSNVWLTNLTVATGGSANGALASTGIDTISFQGVAESRADVANWLESLVKEKGYTNPYVSTTQEALIGDETVVDFTSTVTVTTDALSGRYTATNGS